MDGEAAAAGAWSMQMCINLATNLVANGVLSADTMRAIVADAERSLCDTRPHQTLHFRNFTRVIGESIDRAEQAAVGHVSAAPGR